MTLVGVRKKLRQESNRLVIYTGVDLTGTHECADLSIGRFAMIGMGAVVMGDAVIGLTLVRPDASPWTFVGLAVASGLIYLGATSGGKKPGGKSGRL